MLIGHALPTQAAPQKGEHPRPRADPGLTEAKLDCAAPALNTKEAAAETQAEAERVATTEAETNQSTSMGAIGKIVTDAYRETTRNRGGHDGDKSRDGRRQRRGSLTKTVKESDSQPRTETDTTEATYWEAVAPV